MSPFRRRTPQVPPSAAAAWFASLIGALAVVGCGPGRAPSGDATIVGAPPSETFVPASAAPHKPTPTATVSGVCAPISPRSLGVAWEPFCIKWLDPFGDETGFVVRLTYFGSGETFEHTVGPNVSEFVFPPAEAPSGAPGAPPGLCVDRGAIEVALSAVRAGKTELFDAALLQGHCGDGGQ